MANAALRDAESLRQQLVGWIRERVDGSGLEGAVFGLSGGIDSAVVCGLASEALGPERCLGLVLPIESSQQDAELGLASAERFQVEALTIDLTPTFQQLLTELGKFRERAQLARSTAPADQAHTRSVPASLARANLKPRLRMMSLYYYANLLGYMVLGTGNRDEFAVGYFTKYGDGGADAFPLGNLVKGEVRALARLLGVPQPIIDRPPSAGLWEGQTDEEELGFTYEVLDRYLIEGSTGNAALDETIGRRITAVAHKSEAPPVAQPR